MKTCTTFRIGNKYLSKRKKKQRFFTKIITPNLGLKNLGLDQQRQPNIFVLQALLEKLHRGSLFLSVETAQIVQFPF